MFLCQCHGIFTTKWEKIYPNTRLRIGQRLYFLTCSNINFTTYFFSKATIKQFVLNAQGVEREFGDYLQAEGGIIRWRHLFSTETAVPRIYPKGREGEDTLIILENLGILGFVIHHFPCLSNILYFLGKGGCRASYWIWSQFTLRYT